MTTNSEHGPYFWDAVCRESKGSRHVTHSCKELAGTSLSSGEAPLVGVLIKRYQFPDMGLVRVSLFFCASCVSSGKGYMGSPLRVTLNLHD